MSQYSAFERVAGYAGEAIVAYRMIGAGDVVLVALSGGADSFVLLETLRRLQKRAPVNFELKAITFDPGFNGFNAAAIAAYCARVAVEHRMVRMDMPAIMAEKRDRRRPCVLCSRLRRGRLYTAAREWGANRLALGHHLDDIIISFLMSLCRGQGLTTMGPNVPGDGGELRVIRPLAFADEELVKRAAAEFDFPQAGRCIYRDELEAGGDRARFRRQLAALAAEIPHLRRMILKSLQDVRPDFLLDRKFLTLPE